MRAWVTAIAVWLVAGVAWAATLGGTVGGGGGGSVSGVDITPAGVAATGQISTTHNPAGTAANQSSIVANPAACAANEKLLTAAVADSAVASVDCEGDTVITGTLTQTGTITTDATIDMQSVSNEDLSLLSQGSGVLDFAKDGVASTAEVIGRIYVDDVDGTKYGWQFTNGISNDSSIRPEDIAYATANATLGRTIGAYMDDSADTGSNTGVRFLTGECTDGKGSTCDAIDTGTVNAFIFANHTTNLMTVSQAGNVSVTGTTTSGSTLTVTTGTITSGTDTNIGVNPNGTGILNIGTQSMELNETTTTTPTCAADGDVGRFTLYSKSAGATISICVCGKVSSVYALTAINAGGDCT